MFSLFEENENRALTIAHRGGGSLAPENTMSAVRKAFDIGADMWELDIRMSADGELIILHDKTLSRTTDVARRDRFRSRRPWPLHRFISAELKELDAGSWFVETDPFGQIRKGRITEEETQRFNDEPVPTLKQAFAFSKEKNFPVNVEIKDLSDIPAGDTIVEKLAALIAEMDMTDRVLVSSFNHDYLMTLKTEHPDISTAALVHKKIPDPIALLKRLKADALNVSYRMATPELIKRVEDHGFFVNVYTVNDGKSITAFKRAGVSGIITDFPQVCIAALNGRAG
jgi:glycerophosphoryl diester phosphodiesterase